jgi:hypothetical protein
MFRMRAANPPADIAILRNSRVAILRRLIAFAAARVRDLGAFTDGKVYLRLTHWVRICLALCFHIEQGALDIPRKVRATAADAADLPEAPERPENIGRMLDLEIKREFDRMRGHISVQRYLRRPFGEVVAMICKGVGMTPDWQAWADEPWAQYEIATQPSGSPHEASSTPAPPPKLRSSRRRPGPRAAAPPLPAKPQKPPNRLNLFNSSSHRATPGALLGPDFRRDERDLGGWTLSRKHRS